MKKRKLVSIQSGSRRNRSSRLLPLPLPSGCNSIALMTMIMTLLLSSTNKTSSRVVSSFLMKNCSKRRTNSARNSFLTANITRRNTFLASYNNTPQTLSLQGSTSLTYTIHQFISNHISICSSSTTTTTQRRMTSSSGDDFDPTMSIQHVNLDKMKELVDEYESKGREESGLIVIDVRGHDEVQATGKLSPNTYTLPLPYIAQQRALALGEDDFLEEFGFPKPTLDETIVFTCKAGIRSDYAAQYAAMEGYTNLINYKGGAMEWFSYN